MTNEELEASAQVQANQIESETMGLSNPEPPSQSFGVLEQQRPLPLQGADIYKLDSYPDLVQLQQSLQQKPQEKVVQPQLKSDDSNAFKQQLLVSKVSELLDARGVPVEKQLRAREIGNTLGLPENVILSDLPTYERQYAQKKDFLTLQDDDTTLAFLSNPQNLRLVHDDLDGLWQFQKATRGLSEGAGQALTEREQGFQLFLDMYNQKKPTEFNVGKETDTKSWAYSSAKAVSHFTTAMGASIGMGGTTGVAIGMSAGSILPGVGTLSGAGAGAVAGISADQAAQVAGFVYQETYKDLISKKVPENEAIRLASEAGTNAFVVNFGLGVIPVGGVANRLIGTMAKGIQSTFAGSVARGAVEGGLAMGAMEAGNVASIENAKRQAGVDNVFSNPTSDKFSAIGERVGTATATGVLSIGAFSGVMHPVGKGLARFLQKGREPLNGESVILDAMDRATETKTHARDTDLFQSYAQTAFDGKELFLPLERVAEEANKDPELWNKIIPNLNEQLQRSIETGEDIAIDGGSFVTYLAGSEDGKRLAGDLRFTPDGATANEVRENFSELDEATKTEVSKLFDQINGNEFNSPEILNRQRVKQTIIDELKKFPQILKADRNATAELITSRYEARAKQNEGRFGGVLEEYRRNPFTFQNVDEFIADNQAIFAIEKKKAENKKKEAVQQILSNEVVGRESVITDSSVIKPVFKGKKLSDVQVKVGDEYVPSTVMIVEADSLNPTLENAENQPRKRERVASEAQIEKYANKLDTNYLTANFPDMVNGTPTLAPDGRIIGGNARAESIKRAYQRGTAEEYRAMVQSEGLKQGVDTSKFKNPVLIRVFNNNIDIRRTAKFSNKDTQAVHSALETAAIDADAIGNLGAFDFNENGELSRSGNEVPIRQFLSKYLVEEQGSFVDDEGHLSVEGERRIQNAILYRAYGDTPLLARMIEDVSPEGRTINTAMARLAPELARIEDSIARGELYDVSLRDDLLVAVGKYLEIKRKKQTVDEYLRQGNLLGDELTLETILFLKTIEENSRSAKKLGDALLDVYRKIESYGDPRAGDLFGDRPIPTKQDILSVLKSEDEPPTQDKITEPTVIQEPITEQPELIQKIEQRLAEDEPVTEQKPKRKTKATKEVSIKPKERSINETVYNQSYEKWRGIKMTTREARAMATIDEAFTSSFAEGFGMKPEDFYNLHPFRITTSTKGLPKGLDIAAWMDSSHHIGDTGTLGIVRKSPSPAAHELAHHYLDVLFKMVRKVGEDYNNEWVGNKPEYPPTEKMTQTLESLKEWFTSNLDHLLNSEEIRLNNKINISEYKNPELLGELLALKKIKEQGFSSVFEENFRRPDFSYKLSRHDYSVARRMLHEAFAESFDVYLSTGEAPTPRMKSVFKDFALFVKEFFNRIIGKISTTEDIMNARRTPYNESIKRIFDDLLTTEAERPSQKLDTLNQGNRGRTVLNDTLKIIQLFKDGDVSTLIHEHLGHNVLEEFIQDATTAPEGTSLQLKTDYETTKQWWKDISNELLTMHEKKNVFKSDKETRAKEKQYLKEIREQGGVAYLEKVIDNNLKATDELSEFARKLIHEVTARGVERYMMEGKAPSKRLAQVFERFMKWFVDFYEKVESLNAPINDQIREVFGRLISADETTQQVKRDANLEPMFPSLEASGMNRVEYDQYVENIKSQNATFLQKVLERQMKALKVKYTQEGEQRLKDIRNRLDRESKKDRHIQTYNRIMGIDDGGQEIGTSLKINPSDVIAVYGKEALKRFPKEIFSADGMSLKSAVEALGYTDRTDFINDLALVQKMRDDVGGGSKMTIEQARQKSIERQAEQELKDLTDPESLYDEALDSLHLSLFEKGLTDELNALSKQAQNVFGIEDLSQVKDLEDFSKNLPLDTSVDKILKYIKLDQKSGDKVQTALKAKGGDYFKAFALRQEQKLARLLQERSVSKLKQNEKDAIEYNADIQKLESFKNDVKNIDLKALQDFVVAIFDDVQQGKLLSDGAKETGTGLSSRDMLSIWGNATGKKEILDPKQYLFIERRKGDTAQRLLSEKKYEEAYITKVEQIIARLMNREALSRAKANLTKIRVEPLTEHVKSLFLSASLEDIVKKHRKFLTSERRAGFQAQRHLANGDYARAYEAKYKQLVSYLMYKEALVLKKEADKAKRLFKRIAKNRTLKDVADDSMAILHRILQDNGYRTIRSQRSRREGYFIPEIEEYFTDKDGNNLPLDKAIQAFIDADPDTRDTIFIADSVKSSDPTDKAVITIGAFKDLYDTVQSIYVHGKAEQELYLGGKRAEFKKFIDDIVTVGWEGRKMPKPDNRATKRSLSRVKSLAEGIYGKGSHVMASVIRASTVLNRLDRYNPNGGFNQLFSRLHEGMGKYLEFTDGFKERMLTFKKNLGMKKFNQFIHNLNNQRLENDLLGDHREDGYLEMYKGDLVGLALHRGSPDNFRKLVEGRAKREDGSLTGWTPENVDTLLEKYMTQEDWNFVQMVWREVGKTWPDLVAVQKRINGIAPDRVVTAPIQTPFGQIEGGYYPLTYEDTFRRVDNSEAVGKDASFGDALNASGAKNRVVNVRKPVSLDLFRGIDQAMRTAYATHLVEPFKDMQKVLNHPKVKKLVEGVFSEEHYKALKDMMEEVKSPNRQNVSMADYVQSWGNWLHGGGIITNFVYAIKPLMDSFAEPFVIPFQGKVSALGYGKAVAKATLAEAWNKLSRNRESEYKWARQFDAVKAIDEAQPQRWEAFETEINERWGTTRKGLRAVRNFGFQILETTSRFTATAVARASFEMYVRKHPDASYREISDFVNKTVRETHISRNVLDQPLVQRNKRNQHLKWFMTFGLKAINSMMDLVYQASDSIFAPTKEQGRVKGAIKSVPLIVNGLIGLAIPQMSYMYLSDKIPKDDEGKPDYFKAMAIAPFYSFVSAFSVIRDFADILFTNEPLAGSNLDSRYRDFAQAVKDAKRLAEGKNEYGKREAHTLLRLFGTMTHFPTKPITGAEYLYRYNTGDIKYDEPLSVENFPERVKAFQAGYEK